MNSTIVLGEDLVAHPSGALWFPSSRTLVIADLHLGYGWAQRRRGELGPLVDERARNKLLNVSAEMNPAEIVFLGDIVHAPRPCEPERQWIEETLSNLAEGCRLIAVRGNHDRAFAREFGHLPVITTDSWQSETVTAIHGDRLDFAITPSHRVLVGHLHPSLSVKDAAGASARLPVFLHSRHCTVLPAFSPFAGGYDVSCSLPAEMLRLFRGETIEAIAASGRRAVPLGPLDLAISRLLESDKGAANNYRFGRQKNRSIG